MSFFKISILYLFLIFLLQLSTIKSYIVLNFKKIVNETLINSGTELNLNNTYEMEQFLFTNYITYLEIGDPIQQVELNLFLNDYGLKMYEGLCFTNSTFFPNLSNSFKELANSTCEEGEDCIYKDNQVQVSDFINFHIYNNSNIENNYKFDFSFVYERTNMGVSSIKNSNEKPCLHLGMNLRCNLYDYFCINFIMNLKNNKIIDSYNVNIIFYENKKEKYDGIIFIGTNSNITQYNNLFKNKELMEDYSSSQIRPNQFELQFDEVYYYKDNEKIVSTNDMIKDKAIFLLNFNYIIGTSYYYKSIKENYFDKYQQYCARNYVMYRYNMFICDKSFNTDDFPTIYFYNNDYNYTFELSSKDLFITKGNKKYFMVIFGSFSYDVWQMGKVFMEKYYFNFNYDSKKVGFYKPMEIDDNDNNNFKAGKNLYIIIYIVSVIIIGGLCYYLGAKLYNKIRKKRVNELEDLVEDEENTVN